MNRFALIILFICIIALPACSEKKTPEQAAVRTKNSLTTLRDMVKAYESRSLDAFLSDVAKSYPEQPMFAKAVSEVFAKYEAIHFTIQYTRMLITIDEKGTVRTAFTWDAEWKAATGSTIKDGGRVTFVFEPGSFKLLAIEGRNPFLAQPGETPGREQS